MVTLDILFCLKLNQNVVNLLHLSHKQTGCGHQYSKTVLWLASQIKGQSLSRERKYLMLKIMLKPKKSFSSALGPSLAPRLLTPTPFTDACFHMQPWLYLGWVGWVGIDFLFGGGFLAFSKTF